MTYYDSGLLFLWLYFEVGRNELVIVVGKSMFVSLLVGFTIRLAGLPAFSLFVNYETTALETLKASNVFVRLPHTRLSKPCYCAMRTQRLIFRYMVSW